MTNLFRRSARIQNQARSPKEWIENWAAFALEPVGFSEAERLKDIDGRIQLRDWPERFGAVAVDAKSGERVVWARNSGVDFIQAIASSCALPGLWPCITIAGRPYCDGGVYSMENADLAQGFERVLVLSPDLPIPTPHTLDQHVAALRHSGSIVEIIRADREVLSVLREAGGNPMDPQIRSPIENGNFGPEQAPGRLFVLRMTNSACNI